MTLDLLLQFIKNDDIKIVKENQVLFYGRPYLVPGYLSKLLIVKIESTRNFCISVEVK